jgi:CheY-like chemotaxis protein
MSKTVLVVEDDATILMCSAQLLSVGYKWSTRALVKRGCQGPSHRPDLIFLDNRHLDSLESRCAHTAKEMSIPILMLTARAGVIDYGGRVGEGCGRLRDESLRPCGVAGAMKALCAPTDSTWRGKS